MATISWGKPRIFIGPKGALSSTAVTFEELSTPVEDSTNLTATAGDKTEATIEGGESEATKYKAPTYELTMNVRIAKDRALPSALKNTDSSIDDIYTKGEVAILLKPESEGAPGFFIQAASVSVIESYTSADGAMWELTFSPNKPSTGATILWGAITLGTESTVGTGDAAYKTISVSTSTLTTADRFHQS